MTSFGFPRDPTATRQKIKSLAEVGGTEEGDSIPTIVRKVSRLAERHGRWKESLGP